MALSHVIRLRGPWEYEPLSPSAASSPSVQPSPGRVKLPTDWADLRSRNLSGRVRFRRRFHRPTGLSPHQQVVIVVEQVPPATAVALDDRPLGQTREAGTPTEFDITTRLRDSNVLTLEIELPPPSATGPFGEVRLEIRG